jgi:hypothetical protein
MIPWRNWLMFAVSALRLSPADFWSLTLAEWRWLASLAPAPAMTADRLAELHRLYPDEPSCQTA